MKKSVLIRFDDRPQSLETEVKEQKQKIEIQRQQLTIISGIIGAILLVMFLQVMAFAYDYWRFHGNAYLQFQNTLKEIKDEQCEEKINNLERDIEELTTLLEEMKEDQATTETKSQSSDK